eukprot:SAG11_NODE_10008_length_862_cov_53.086501_1_plen_43_part_01
MNTTRWPYALPHWIRVLKVTPLRTVTCGRATVTSGKALEARGA